MTIVNSQVERTALEKTKLLSCCCQFWPKPISPWSWVLWEEGYREIDRLIQFFFHCSQFSICLLSSFVWTKKVNIPKAGSLAHRRHIGMESCTVRLSWGDGHPFEVYALIQGQLSQRRQGRQIVTVCQTFEGLRGRSALEQSRVNDVSVQGLCLWRQHTTSELRVLRSYCNPFILDLHKGVFQFFRKCSPM